MSLPLFYTRIAERPVAAGAFNCRISDNTQAYQALHRFYEFLQLLLVVHPVYVQHLLYIPLGKRFLLAEAICDVLLYKLL